MGNQCLLLKPGCLRTSQEEARGRLAAILWSKGEEKTRWKFLAKLSSESHESPSLSGALEPATLTTTPRLPSCVHHGKKQKLQCTQFEIYMFVCLSYLNCTMLHEISLKKNQHTPLQGNPMRFFFVCLFFKQICTEKKKNPRVTPYTIRSPCPVMQEAMGAGTGSVIDDTGYGKTLSSLCSPVYLVQNNYIFFKHIYRVCTNRKWLQITTRLGKISSPPPLSLTEAGGTIALYLQMH